MRIHPLRSLARTRMPQCGSPPTRVLSTHTQRWFVPSCRSLSRSAQRQRHERRWRRSANVSEHEIMYSRTSSRPCTRLTSLLAAALQAAAASTAVAHRSMVSCCCCCSSRCDCGRSGCCCCWRCARHQFSQRWRGIAGCCSNICDPRKGGGLPALGRLRPDRLADAPAAALFVASAAPVGAEAQEAATRSIQILNP